MSGVDLRVSSSVRLDFINLFWHYDLHKSANVLLKKTSFSRNQLQISSDIYANGIVRYYFNFAFQSQKPDLILVQLHFQKNLKKKTKLQNNPVKCIWSENPQI